MTKPYLARLQQQGPWAQTAWLALAVTAALALVGPLAAWHHGPGGLMAATVAAALCFAGAALALRLSHRLRGPKLLLLGVLLGMTARLGVPLGLGLFLHLSSDPLGKAGLLYYLLIFYPVSLASEIYLSLGAVGQPGKNAA